VFIVSGNMTELRMEILVASGDFLLIISSKFWAFYCIFVYAHHSELMKSMGFMAASQMVLMMEVMV